MANNDEWRGKKAVLYARQSSGRDDKSLSTEVQIEQMRELCAKNEIEIIGEYIDNNRRCEMYEDTPIGRASSQHDDGFETWRNRQKTKRTLRYREGLAFALKETINADYLMILDDTRLYRAVEGSNLINHINNILRGNNCDIFYCATSRVRHLKAFDENLFAEIEERILQRDLEHKRARSLDGIEKRKKERKTVSSAWGVVRKFGDKNLYFDEKITPIIRFIYTAFSENKSMGHILWELNANYREFLISFRRKNKIMKGKRYYITNVQNVLKNPTYSGLMFFHGRYVKAVNIPNPIIDEPLFYRVQKKLLDSRKSRVKTVIDGVKIERGTYPFSGLMYCGCCSGKMVISIDKSNLYYICKNAVETRNAECSQCRIRVNDFDDFSCLQTSISKLFLISLIEQQKRAYMLANSNDECDNLQREIASLDRIRKDTIRARNEELITTDEYLTELRRIANENKAKTAELRKIQIQQHDDIDKIIDEAYSAIMTQDISDSMYFDFLHNTVSTITVYANKINIVLTDGNSFDLPRFETRSLIKRRGGSCKVLPKGETVYNFNREYKGDSLLNYEKESIISFYSYGENNVQHVLVKTPKYVISYYDNKE